MRFSLVNGQRQKAEPEQSGKCPVCDQAMVAKCGKVKIWHWAHKGHHTCDPWWENETQWHRAWKGQFPEDWQEFVQCADSGEKHVADVKTDQGWVIEFQHSYLKPDERRSRDDFYPKLVWVVDGARRTRDFEQFCNAFNRRRPIVGKYFLIPRLFSDKCILLQEWVGSNAPVFSDFGVESLFFIPTRMPDGSPVVAPFPRGEFIEIFRGGATQRAREFEEFVNSLRNPASNAEPHPST